ncbi:LysR family transcriptional regulator [Roseomonas sp. GCM10028921]
MRPLDPEAVEAFVLVANLRSFTRAAGVLNTTQAAVSLRLRRLEERLGQRLLDRTPRQVRLSAAGERFLGPARDLVAAGRRASSSAPRIGACGSGHLRSVSVRRRRYAAREDHLHIARPVREALHSRRRAVLRAETFHSMGKALLVLSAAWDATHTTGRFGRFFETFQPRVPARGAMSVRRVDHLASPPGRVP